MSDLKAALEKLAADFAAAAVAAIQQASLDEIAGLAGARTSRAPAARAPRASTVTRVTRRGRRRRRTAADIRKVMAEIAALLAKHKGGLRAEQIRAELGIPRNDLPRPIAEGLKGGKFRKRGQKRATVYFVGGATAAPKRAKPKTSQKAKAKPARSAAALPKRRAAPKRKAPRAARNATPAVTNGAAKAPPPAA